MSTVDLALLILAVSVPLTALAIGGAFWVMVKSQQANQLAVLDRFLSRNMSEYGMTDLVRREVEAEQISENEETEDDKAFETWLANKQSSIKPGDRVMEVVG